MALAHLVDHVADRTAAFLATRAWSRCRRRSGSGSRPAPDERALATASEQGVLARLGGRCRHHRQVEALGGDADQAVLVRVRHDRVDAELGATVCLERGSSR